MERERKKGNTGKKIVTYVQYKQREREKPWRERWVVEERIKLFRMTSEKHTKDGHT
jgi:hypothetical protein